MIPTNVIPFPEVEFSARFGVCPYCGKTDGYVNLGKEHWFICREDKTKWFGGANMFENWKNQTVAQAQKIEEMLDGFNEVEPLKQTEQKKISSSAP